MAHSILIDISSMVVVIVHGEMPDIKEMDEDVQKYLKSNTFIRSNDPWFWKKLR